MSDELSGQEVPPEDLPDDANLSGQEVPASDLPDDISLSGQEVPESDLPDSEKEEPGFLQRLGSNLAGPKAGQSFSKEEMLSPPENAKDIIGSAAGSNLMALPGTPLASFWARGAKGALETFAAQAGDEIDKASLGQGDPAPAVAARLAGSIIPGFIIGGITGQRPESVETAVQLADKKTSSLLSDMFVGASHVAFGDPTAPIPPQVKSKLAFKAGQTLANATKSRLVGSMMGAMTGGLEGSLIVPAAESAIKHLFGDKLSAISRKRLAPMLMNAAASGPIRNPSQIISHAAAITRGDTAMSKGIESLFVKGGQKAYDDAISDNDTEKLKDHIENGGPVEQEKQNQQDQQAQGYAEGGEIEPISQTPNNEIANHWPEQNIMLNATRNRVHNYLNSIRPTKNINKLPFDTEIKDPQKDREYNRAIHLAAKPLSILNHVKDGTLLPKHMSAFNSMYPELHQELSKRMMKRMLESQLHEEKKPPYHVRQAMSLFMGGNLDSTLTPMAMQNAQAVFMKQKAQQAPPSKTSVLGKAGKAAQTSEQARTAALNKS